MTHQIWIFIFTALWDELASESQTAPVLLFWLLTSMWRRTSTKSFFLFYLQVQYLRVFHLLDTFTIDKWVRQALEFNIVLVVLIILEVASIAHGDTTLNVLRNKKRRRGSSFTGRQWERDQTYLSQVLSWQQHIFFLKLDGFANEASIRGSIQNEKK